MNLNEKQYERLALWLDGRDVELTAEEQALAETIRRREEQISGMLDAPIEPVVIGRVKARIAAGARARPRRRILFGIAAAAAAATVIAVVLWRGAHPGGDGAGPVVPNDVMFGSTLETPDNEEIDILAEEIDSLEAEIIAGGMLPELEFQIDETGREVEEFWLEYPSGVEPDRAPFDDSG